MPTCPVCNEHAHARLRACDSRPLQLAGMYRHRGPDGRFYLHELEWPQGVPDAVLTDSQLADKRA